MREEHVRQERLQAVDVAVHWAYLFGVMGGSLLLMILLVALLGGTASG